MRLFQSASHQRRPGSPDHALPRKADRGVIDLSLGRQTRDHGRLRHRSASSSSAPILHMTVKHVSKRGRTRKRILLVDDHPILREGLLQSINREPDLLVCGEAENAHQALSAISRLKPDLVLVDIGLPGKSGFELVKDIRTVHPEVPVLVFSMHDESLYAERVLRAGAR